MGGRRPAAPGASGRDYCQNAGAKLLAGGGGRTGGSPGQRFAGNAGAGVGRRLRGTCAGANAEPADGRGSWRQPEPNLHPAAWHWR